MRPLIESVRSVSTIKIQLTRQSIPARYGPYGSLSPHPLIEEALQHTQHDGAVNPEPKLS